MVYGLVSGKCGEILFHTIGVHCQELLFYLYSQCTGDHSYKERAENIVRNNLCLFFEDGKASCAYIYPNKVNGVKGGFYDPYANDQDWALVYYLLVQNGIY